MEKKPLAKSNKTPIIRPSVGEIVAQLIAKMGIKEADLARQTGFSKTAINRLLIGKTTDPRVNTLKPIAKFFGLTISQIVGEEPINLSQITGSLNESNRNVWAQAPIISWEEIIPWIFRKGEYNLHKHVKWVTTELPISQNSFAVISKPSMAPIFRENSTLLVDPEMKISDGNFALITFDGTGVGVRKIISDNSNIYLKHYDTSIPTIKFEKDNHNILGIIVETRINLY